MALVPHSVIEIGKMGYAVVTAGNLLVYVRWHKGIMEYSTDPSMFSRVWKSRAAKAITDKLCDIQVPRRVWVRGVK